MFVFSHFFLTMGIHFPLVLGVLWINRKNLSKSMSEKDMGILIYSSWNGKKSQISSKTHSLGAIKFFTEYFHVIRILHISRHRGLHEFSLTLKLQGRTGPGICLCFPYLFCNLGINSSHRLGIVWISASREICKKLIPLEYSMFWKLYELLLHAK